jgi:hypothetical protein
MPLFGGCSDEGRHMSDLVNVLRSHLVSFATMDAAADRIEQLEVALRIIAGYEQCIDNLMSNQNIAIAALDQSSPPARQENDDVYPGFRGNNEA